MKGVLITVEDMRILDAVYSHSGKEKLAHAHVEVVIGTFTHIHLHSRFFEAIVKFEWDYYSSLSFFAFSKSFVTEGRPILT